MKKFLVVLLACLMLVSLVACKAPAKTADPVTGPDNLAGHKVGVQLGTTGHSLMDYEEDVIVEAYKSAFEAVQALQTNKIDAVVIDEQTALAFLETNDDIKILDTEYAVEEYAICLKKGNSELLTKINGAIATLKQNGVYEQLVDHYLLKKEGSKPYTKAENVTTTGTLTMATNAFFPPFEYYDENDNIAGFDVDFTQAICDLIGYELKIEQMEFDGIILAVNGGTADIGVAGMSVTEERKQSVDFTDTYITSHQVIIVNK